VRGIEKRDCLLLALILVGFALYTFVLPPIWNHGEAREGLGIQDIVRHHHWILPYRNGEPPSKPPLFHWIGAALAFLFGLSDFIVRLPSVLAAGIVAVVAFILGTALGGRKTAWLAVGALLGMYQFWISGTEARVDMVFAACVTVSLAGFFFWYSDGRESARVTCYLAAMLAVLAKGPVGIALPGLVIVAFLAVERRFSLIWKLWSWPLIAAALLIDLGWYALAYRTGGEKFFAWQIMHENVDQLFGTHGFESNKTTLSMLGWIPTRTFPWNLALVWGLMRWRRGESEDSAGRFLYVWWFAITAFFFLVNIKRSIYLLPTYPAVALLAARALTSIGSRAAESNRPIEAPLGWLFQTPRRAIATIVLLDLALVLFNPRVWQRAVSYRSTLAFVQEVGARVPQNTPLFAATKLRGSDLLIAAYRLQRTIPRKPLACAGPNDYFLLRPEMPDTEGIEMQVLAASRKNDAALVTVTSTGDKPCSSENLDVEEDDAD
jgi:4-amino-4-deoxy-L-arabinose transferase-like glycosyltransferase